jgi:hypothetical protein
MDIIKTDGDIKRERDVNIYINKIMEHDTSAQTIKTILLKFPDLKGFTYMRSEELHEGSLLRTVDLNIEKLSVPAIIVGIKKGSTGAIINITLYNNNLDSYWKILPSKYYLFTLEPSENKHVKRLIADYIDMGFKIK